jgi:hypothetical protein
MPKVSLFLAFVSSFALAAFVIASRGMASVECIDASSWDPTGAAPARVGAFLAFGTLALFQA